MHPTTENESSIMGSEHNNSCEDLPKTESETESTDKTPIVFSKLNNKNLNEIKFVYHISDIHIRNLDRHIEYQQVFQKLYKVLRKKITDKNNSIIVVTGDIVHAKTQIVPELIHITQDFFIELTKIAPVVLIPGNHDCNLSNRERMDALTPILTKNIKIENLYYLLQSGFYQLQNIIFGVTSVFDKKLLTADKLPEKHWKNLKIKNKYMIALFHGSVHGAKTDVGYRMNNDQLLVDDFDGYDYVMLGDIHKYQYMDDNKRVAYSGSLIQQSYGENLRGHGVLVWDLENKSSNLVEIPNDYGFCKIKIINGVMEPTFIPKRPRINFRLSETTQIQYQKILDKLQNKYDICEITRDSEVRNIVHKKTKKINTGKVSAIANQEDMINEHLKKKNYSKHEINSVVELHKKLYQLALVDKKDQVVDKMHNALSVQRWRILELQFSNMISYGKNNIIDFRKYEKNTVVGIVAPNFTGKSAIIDILLFCLFDKYSRGERRDILNKNENRMSCSLLFSIGAETYLIERIGQRSKNGQTVKIDVNFFQTTLENDTYVKNKLNGIDKNEKKKKITDIVGSYNDYIIFSI